MARRGPESPPVAERRGAVGHENGNSYTTMLVRAPIETLAAALKERPEVASVRRRVKGRVFAKPDGEAVVLVRLRGHSWTCVVPTGLSGRYAVRWFAELVGARGLLAGYQDTANATEWEVFDGGELVEMFSTTGEDFPTANPAREGSPEAKRGVPAFRSDLREVELSRFRNEAEYLDAAARALDVYVPIVGMDGSGPKLKLSSWPEDVLSEAAVERVDLVAFRRVAGRPWDPFQTELLRRLTEPFGDLGRPKP